MLQEVYKPRKTFSLAEANRTLPLVSRIIQDIVRANEELVKAHERARRLAQEGQSLRAEGEEDRAYELGHQIQGFLEELERIGCLCKDPVRGLVDFPCRVGAPAPDGGEAPRGPGAPLQGPGPEPRIVFLCWKRGEPEIQFFHEVDAGFAGRKPVRGLFAKH